MGFLRKGCDRLRLGAGLGGALALLVGTLALAGCVSTGPGQFGGRPVMTRPGAPASVLGQTGEQPILSGVANPLPSGARVALLAPLSGPNAERGTALAQAAKLALEVPGAPALDVLDTQGTQEGAAAAARTALSNGAGLILGPLTAQETAAAATVTMAAGVGMLAFTSDATQQRPGVWVLGLTPQQQVRRLVVASMGQGKSHFAALLPPNDFGRAMSDALTQAASSAGAGSPDIRTVDASSMSSANSAVRDLSGDGGRRGPLDAQIKAARMRESISQGWRQQMVHPAAGAVSGRFGAQRVFRGVPAAYHAGMDIAAPSGTPIVAPADGVVVLAVTGEPFTLEGHLVILDHGMGLNSAMLHSRALAVSEGMVLRQEQTIGEVGMTGRATGPHLHWGLTWHGHRLDPLLFLA